MLLSKNEEIMVYFYIEARYVNCIAIFVNVHICVALCFNHIENVFCQSL